VHQIQTSLAGLVQVLLFSGTFQQQFTQNQLKSWSVAAVSAWAMAYGQACSDILGRI
jgi:hypothetical protein